jgi:hypothetical protein
MPDHVEGGVTWVTKLFDESRGGLLPLLVSEPADPRRGAQAEVVKGALQIGPQGPDARELAGSPARVCAGKCAG